MKAHWEIDRRRNGEFIIRVRASNGKIVLPGGYRRRWDAKRAIQIAVQDACITDCMPRIRDLTVRK